MPLRSRLRLAIARLVAPGEAAHHAPERAYFRALNLFHAVLIVVLTVVLGLLPARAPAAEGTPGITPRVLVLPAGAEAVDAWPAVTMLADPERDLAPAEALARLAQFTAPDTPHGNLGPRRGAVWLAIDVRPAPDDDGQWLLEIDYPALDQIGVHVFAAGRASEHWLTGDALAYTERPVVVRPHAVKLRLTPGLEHRVLLRIESTSTLVTPVRFVRLGRMHADDTQLQAVQGAAAGIGLALLMYAFGHFAVTRDRMYLWYSLQIGGTTLFFVAHHGLGMQHLWPGHAWLTAHVPPLAALVAIFGGARLFVCLLDMQAITPRLALAMKFVSNAAAVAALLFATGLIGYRVAQTLATALGGLPMALALPAAFLRARQGDRAAVNVLIGLSVYVAGVVAMVGLLRGWSGIGPFTQHAFQAGSLFEMLVWLRVMSLRQDAMRRGAERAEHERALMASLAHTDPLTGLPNRRGLEQALSEALTGAGSGRTVAVCLLDLDGFKAVNDDLGHDAGDELLVAVAQRLRGQLRQGDVIARLGGDEFVVVARGLGGEAHAWSIGRKLLLAFEEPFVVRGERHKVGLTIGFALAPADGLDAAHLLRQADAAMYAGKQRGKGQLRRGDTMVTA